MGIREQAGAEALRAVATVLRAHAHHVSRITCGRHPQSCEEASIQQCREDARLLDKFASRLEEGKPLDSLLRAALCAQPEQWRANAEEGRSR